MAVPSFSCRPLAIIFRGDELPVATFEVVVQDGPTYMLTVELEAHETYESDLGRVLAGCSARAIRDLPEVIVRRSEIDKQMEGLPGVKLAIN